MDKLGGFDSTYFCKANYSFYNSSDSLYSSEKDLEKIVN